MEPPATIIFTAPTSIPNDESVVKQTTRLKSKVSCKGKTVEVGDVAPDFELGDCAGARHTLSGFRGRPVLLSSFRYAACPICRYNVDKMNKQAVFLKQLGIVHICIFPNSPETMARYSMENTSFLALSDDDGLVYSSFQVKRMTFRTMIVTSIEILKKKKYKKYFDWSAILRDTRGRRGYRRSKQMPADFLIDEHGTVVDLFRAKNFPDHITIDRIEAFILKDNTCKCSSKEETNKDPQSVTTSLGVGMPTSVDEGFAEPWDFK